MQGTSVTVNCPSASFLCKYLKTKSGNREKMKTSNGAMQDTKGERSSWINEEKSQATDSHD